MMLKKMSQHPYDLDFTEIEKHKLETYKVKQSGIVDCDTNAEATLEVHPLFFSFMFLTF